MPRWSFRLILLAGLVVLVGLGGATIRRERDCIWTNRCEERLRGLGIQLEFYSSDHVIEAEKRLGHTSERRAFYPQSLDDLVAKNYARESELRCPVYGVPYRYVPLDGGKSYLLYCPARHRLHFSSRPFVTAVEPDTIGLHLIRDGDQVFDVGGSHGNPWDFQGVPGKRKATDIPASLIQMVSRNPAPVSYW